MLSDLLCVLSWWGVIFAIGLIFFPLTKKIFNKFFDQGYLFSKVIGILFSTYLVWLAGSLKIAPFSQLTVLVVLLLGLVVNFLILRPKLLSTKSKAFFFLLTSYFSHHTLIYVAEELMFFLALIFWSYIRAMQPDIQGLEKFMDFGFVNSILRSKYFPPADMWFAGKSINYYYFGHFITAFLTKLTGINPAVTYNLMIATLFAFCFSLTFSLTGNLIYFYLFKNFENLKIACTVTSVTSDLKFKIKNLKLIIIGGLISALLISLGANLHPAYYNFQMNVLKKPYCDGATTYWYPNATRYIGYCPEVEDKTIHEFPSYSFIVSDLHGHVSDIPFVLTILASILVLFLKIKENKDISLLKFLSSNLHLPLLFGITFMTNQWDFPIYLLIFGLTILAAYFLQFGWQTKTLLKSLTLGVPVLFLSILLVLPFQLNFENMAKGIGIVRANSLFYQLLILWGAPWFFAVSFLIFLFGKKIKPKQLLNKEGLVKWFSQILGVKIELKSQKTQSLITNHQSPQITDIFILILFFVGTLLIIVPEIIYLKDIYIPSYHRANTMFKLTYQSFTMFSCGIGYIFVRILSSMRKSAKKIFLRIAYCVLFIALMVYPFYSIPGYYGKLKISNYKGLYGLKFVEKLYPDDYQAILWLNKNISGQPITLEAVGDSYTDYERISMATGLPTIEGWLVHEWLWRGSFDEPGKRSAEVQTIYESNDLDKTKELLLQYKVKYLVIGEMEREKYPKLNEKKFQYLGKKVFESKSTAIWELI